MKWSTPTESMAFMNLNLFKFIQQIKAINFSIVIKLKKVLRYLRNILSFKWLKISRKKSNTYEITNFLWHVNQTIYSFSCSVGGLSQFLFFWKGIKYLQTNPLQARALEFFCIFHWSAIFLQAIFLFLLSSYQLNWVLRVILLPYAKDDQFPWLII